MFKRELLEELGGGINHSAKGGPRHDTPRLGVWLVRSDPSEPENRKQDVHDHECRQSLEEREQMAQFNDRRQKS